jgi:FkbM family methyltransferase
MVVWLRYFARRPVVLALRNGVRVTCRPGTSDWTIVHELSAGSYSSALRYLSARSGPGLVLDLGGNIGCFSLVCAALNANVRVVAYEPEPSNLSTFRENLALNPGLAERIAVHPSAVAGLDGRASLNVAPNLAGTNIIPEHRGSSTDRLDVAVASFSRIVSEHVGVFHLVKMDIEGSEFSIVESTPPALWARIPAIAMEIHEDLALGMRRNQLLQRFDALGYAAEEDRVGSWFLQRPGVTERSSSR